MNTVPNKVDQLVRAQLHHDRRQHNERASKLMNRQDPGPRVDYLTPIVADGDTGHGGLSAVMKLTKLFVETTAIWKGLLVFLPVRSAIHRKIAQELSKKNKMSLNVANAERRDKDVHSK